MATPGYWQGQFVGGAPEAVACGLMSELSDVPGIDKLRQWLESRGVEVLGKAPRWTNEELGRACLRSMRLVEHTIERIENGDPLLRDMILRGLWIRPMATGTEAAEIRKEDPASPLLSGRYSTTLEEWLAPLLGAHIVKMDWWKANSKTVKRLISNGQTVKQVMTE